MSFVKQFNGQAPAAAANCVATVPAGGVPVGESILIGVATLGFPTTSCVDSKGNVYTRDRTKVTTGVSTSTAIWKTVVTTALVEGDTITVACSGGSPTRWAVACHHFTDKITSTDGGAEFDNGGVAASALSAGTATTDDVSGLAFAAFSYQSSGRTFTPGASPAFTGGTKVNSLAGSGDRSIVCQWRYFSGTTATPATAGGGSTIYGAVSQGYGLDAPSDPPPGGTVLRNVVIDAALRPITAKNVIVDGVKRPITHISVIQDGVKMPTE